MGWNVYSPSDYKTQVKFINKLKSAPENVFVLCDTCLGSDSERVFRKLWGEQAYFNLFSTSQRGLAILIKDCLQIENVIKGNYTRFAFKVREQNILLKCIYACNEDMTNSETDNESNVCLLYTSPSPRD